MAIRYLPAPIEETPPSPQPPALVVFGRNRSGRPRAAWFDASQAEAATKAAGLMELRTLPLAGDEQQAVAAQLIQGRVLPNGKAHVPGARRDLYGRLVTFAGERPTSRSRNPTRPSGSPRIQPPPRKLRRPPPRGKPVRSKSLKAP